MAYRCRDAKETVAFYRDFLGIEFTIAFAEDRVPSTGEPDTYMHVFLDAGMGNVLAFFELPNAPDDMLEEWNRTKRAPRHAAWLHEKALGGADSS